ncbi:MAG: aldehyde ferredoxin oxidoreductase family protein [Candidatus Methanoperedens sp.]|nr:aldehyde ferredoxin oxidoreductase family protein [Candidatus Methanoperedens sp.]
MTSTRITARIDLSKKKILVCRLNKKLETMFLGGRGINSALLYEEVPAGIDPFSPENRIIFGTGPLTGTLSPGSGRYTVTSKSPLTGIHGDSNAGGFWGPELRFAGYDHLIIQGRAEKPVYLWINDGSIEIRDASHLWGKTTWETDLMIKKELEDPAIQVASIGPAGENLVRYACIINNLWRAAGRTGMGAVMGSKNLKAVAVRGTGDAFVAKPDELMEYVKELNALILADPAYSLWSKYGTPGLINPANMLGILVTENDRRSTFADADKICGETFCEKHAVKSNACFNCPIHCGHYYVVDNEKMTAGGGPQFAALANLGSRCCNSDLGSILGMNTLCNQQGIDVCSAGVALSFSMECFERGIISKRDTEGIELDWGNSESMVAMLKKISRREGFGNILADGAWRASQIIGKNSHKYAMTIKGADSPDYDPRALKGWGLAYAVSTRGGDHLRALPALELLNSPQEYEKLGLPVAGDRFSYDSKAILVKWHEDVRAIADSLEICKFLTRTTLLSPEYLARLLGLVTGVTMTTGELLRAGERVINIERMFCVREGISRMHDTLPERYTKEPLPDGPGKGETINIEKMLDEYYVERGWDLITGIPLVKKLNELGLNKIIAKSQIEVTK